MIIKEQKGMDKLIICGEKEKDVDDEQILCVGGSGIGKTLLLERIIYNFWKKGFQIIIATDQKNLLELGFMTFPPHIMRQYQKKELRRTNRQPISIPIKIFHPFCFTIPDYSIPETRFFTFPLSALGDSEFALLLETSEDKSTRELLVDTISKIKKNYSIWDWMQVIESSVERKVQQQGSYDIKLPDPHLFFIRGASTGTIKNMDEIARIFARFQKYYFLTPEDHPLNLDWKKEVFNDNSVKIFTTRYIKRDEKSRHFFTLLLLNQIVENAHFGNKNGILVVLDEVKDLCSSDKTVTYSKILASNISSHLNTNFRARHISSVSSSQSFAGINKKLTRSNCFTKTFIMRIDGEEDLKQLKDIYGCDNDDIKSIISLKQNSFYVRGLEEAEIDTLSPLKALLPPFPHCEAGYLFDKFFARFFPDKMKKYSDLKKSINDEIKEIKKRVGAVAYERIKKEREAKKQLEKEKEKVKEAKEELKEVKQKELSEKQKRTGERNQKIWEEYRTGTVSQYQLAKKFGVKQPMIFKILKKMEGENEANKKGYVDS